MNVQNISSLPPYLNKFMKDNFDKLNEIYTDHKENIGEGCLSFKCKGSENKVDVMYMVEELIIQNFSKETWENLKRTRGDQKIYLIEDLEKSSMFIVYV